MKKSVSTGVEREVKENFYASEHAPDKLNRIDLYTFRTQHDGLTPHSEEDFKVEDVIDVLHWHCGGCGKLEAIKRIYFHCARTSEKRFKMLYPERHSRDDRIRTVHLLEKNIVFRHECIATDIPGIGGILSHA